MQLLHIDSSIHGDQGVSAILTAELVALLQAKENLEVKHRDLSSNRIPHLNAATHGAFGIAREQLSAAQQQTLTLSDTFIAELKSSDTIVIGVPMYNFGIPSELKAWLDHVARAGETFSYTSAGPKGLLASKRLIIIATRGGQYQGTAKDTQSAYLKQVFGFMGLVPEFIYVEGLAMGAHRDQAIDHARQAMATLATG